MTEEDYTKYPAPTEEELEKWWKYSIDPHPAVPMSAVSPQVLRLIHDIRCLRRKLAEVTQVKGGSTAPPSKYVYVVGSQVDDGCYYVLGVFNEHLNAMKHVIKLCEANPGLDSEDYEITCEIVQDENP